MSEANTSDLQERSNMLTREAWLHEVLFSGRVTRVAQHLALAIHAASDGTGVLRASLRDLEKATGWSRTAISKHVSELEAVATIAYGAGRAKSSFALPYADTPEEFIEVVTIESKASLRPQVIAEFGHRCSHCDLLGSEDLGPDSRPWCLDRIIPGAVGGKYQADNLTLSCWACNSRRGASPIEKRIFSLGDWRVLHRQWIDVGAAIEDVEAHHG